MNNINAYVVKTLSSREYIAPGHRACAGAVRSWPCVLKKALGRNVIVASATGCMEIVSSPFPLLPGGPVDSCSFENAAGCRRIEAR